MEFDYEIHTIALHRPLKPINNEDLNWHSCLKKKNCFLPHHCSDQFYFQEQQMEMFLVDSVLYTPKILCATNLNSQM